MQKLLAVAGLIALSACSKGQPPQQPPMQTFIPTSFRDTVTGKGQPVILIPGLGLGPDEWQSTIDHLSPRYEVHAISIAGFAGEPPRANVTSVVPALRDDLVAYIRAKGWEKPILIGHSLGGFTAYFVAAALPGHIAKVVSIDALADLPAAMSGGTEPTSETVQQMGESRRTAWANADAATFAQMTHRALEPMANDPSTIASVVDHATHGDPRTVGQRSYDCFTLDARPLLSRIDAPLLFIGADSPMQDAAQTQLASVPHHEIVVLKNTRHFVMFDDPAGYFAALDAFLAASR